MSIEIRALAGAGAVLATLGAAPAVAQDLAWDADADGMISDSEFAAGFGESGVFDTWDADEDAMLSGDEFTEGVFGAFDADVSGDLVETEYGPADGVAGAPGFWGDDPTGIDYGAWDADGDGVIQAAEFAEGWDTLGRFDEWDADLDGGLSEPEFTAGVFDRYDRDDTTLVDGTELGAIGTDFGDAGFWNR